MQNNELDNLMEKIEEDAPDENSGEQDTIAGQVIELIKAKDIYAFHDQDGNGYAKLKINDRLNVYRIKGDEFGDYVSYVAWDELGKAISATVKNNVVGTFDSIAKFKGKKYELSLRTAWHETALWYDLGDGGAVKIRPEGWEIVNEPPILFKKSGLKKPQVKPEPGGKVDEILKYLNIDPNKREQLNILLLTYLAASLIPDIPRPIFILHGLQGSAKSTFFRIIKSIIDPSPLEVLTYPRNSQELIQLLSHHYLICFDNLSELDEWQSDELCRACTGQAFSKRELYSDDDDIVYHYKRLIGINGINLVATKPDLLDRSLIFELQPISKELRIDEETFWKNFESEKPKILGAVFTALSQAMRLRNEITLEKKPRLADYALWCAAVCPAIGRTKDDFIAAYNENIERQNIEAIEASVIALVIIDYMKDDYEVKMSSKSLHEELKKHAGELGFDNDPDFPKSARWLWRKIKIVKANLQAMDFDIEYLEKTRPREILIRNNKNVPKNDVNDANDVGQSQKVPF